MWFGQGYCPYFVSGLMVQHLLLVPFLFRTPNPFILAPSQAPRVGLDVELLECTQQPNPTDHSSACPGTISSMTHTPPHPTLRHPTRPPPALRVGLDVELLERTQQSILKLFSAEEVERAVTASSGGSTGSSGSGAAGGAAAGASAGACGAANSSGGGGGAEGGEEYDPALSSAIADLHKFSMMQVGDLDQGDLDLGDLAGVRVTVW